MMEQVSRRMLNNHGQRVGQMHKDTGDDRYRDLRRPRKLRFYVNGDRYFRGKKLYVTPNRYYNFNDLLNDLTGKLPSNLNLPYGVRQIFTPSGGRRIFNVEDLTDGATYVCAGFEGFKTIKYGRAELEPWSMARPQQNPNQEVEGEHHGSLRYRDYANNAFHPGRYFRTNQSYQQRRWPGTYGAHQRGSYPIGQSENLPQKPKVVTVIRNGAKPRHNVKILLNRRSVQSYEQLVSDISEAFGPNFKHSKVRKLFSVRGKEVLGISDFFREDECFIALGVGEANLSDTDVAEILEEMFPDGQVSKSLLKEWERNQRRRRHASPTGASLELPKDTVHGNNHLNIAHPADKRDSGFDSSDASTNRSEPDQPGPPGYRKAMQQRRKAMKDRESEREKDRENQLETSSTSPQHGYHLMKKLEKERMKGGAAGEKERAKRRQMKMAEAEKRTAEEEKRKRGLVPLRNIIDPFKKGDDARSKEKEDGRRRREEERKKKEEERLDSERERKEERENAEKSARERMALAEKSARERMALAEKEEKEKDEKDKVEREKQEKEKREQEKVEREKQEKEKREQAKVEKEKQEKEKREQAKVEMEKQEKEKREKEEKERRRTEKEEQKKQAKNEKAAVVSKGNAKVYGGGHAAAEVASKQQQQQQDVTYDHKDGGKWTESAVTVDPNNNNNNNSNDNGDTSSTAAVEQQQQPQQQPQQVSSDNNNNNNNNNKDTASVKQKEKRKQEKDEKQQQRKRAKTKIVRRTKAERQVSSDEFILSHYDLGRKLGDGNFAIVRQSRKKETGQEYAIKVIDKAKLKGKEHMVENEIDIMKDCSHNNIVRLYEEYETAERLYLVMELVKGGDLFDAITQSVKFGEVESALMVKDLCNALFYLHSRSIVHRDLKPENLLVHRNKDGSITLKLADFGLAMEVKELIHTVCGTPTYVAPEILTENGYGLEVDMWAVGVITYILLCGFPPFRSPDRNQTELFEFIKAGDYEFLSPYWDNTSKSAKDVVHRLLVVDRQKRYSAVDVLSHRWVVCCGDANTVPVGAISVDAACKEARKELEAQAKLNHQCYQRLKEKKRPDPDKPSVEE